VELHQQLIALAQIIMIDFVLAGDNAIVVGMAAARVDPKIRARVIMLGIAGAVGLRISFAAVATQLLLIVGLSLAGGILLLWVCWKMYREIRLQQHEPAFAAAAGHGGPDTRGMSFGAAITQIIVADVSMSLDNVLAVAGAAKGEIWVLAVGLTIAIVFMAMLSAYIAGLLARHPWISWIGLAIILYVALDMIWSGTHQIGCAFVAPATCSAGAMAIFSALL